MTIHQIQLMLKNGCEHTSDADRDTIVVICRKCASQAIMFLDLVVRHTREAIKTVDNTIEVIDKALNEVEGQSER